MVIDFDKFPSKKDLDNTLNILKNNIHIVSAFISPSNNGIKAVVKIPKCDAIEHERYFKAFHEKFDYDYFDISNCNVDRVCYESYDPNIYINTMGWDPEIANSYTKTLLDMEKSKNRVFPLRVPGVFEFTSAVATGTSKALAGQLSPQEALDEVAKEWEAIVKRVGKKAVQDAYAVGVKMEDNKL